MDKTTIIPQSKPKSQISNHILRFNKEYDNFQSFMSDSRDTIYRTILTAFKELKEKESVSINIRAKIGETNFKSNLNYTKLNLNLLTDIINVYFEEIEDYEMCDELMKIHSELQKKSIG